MHDYWFWYPIFGQLIGGVLGGLLYTLTISAHHPEGHGQTQVPPDVAISNSDTSDDRKV